MKLLLTIWISAVLIQEVFPNTLDRVPKHTLKKPTSTAQIEYEASFLQNRNCGHGTSCVVAGKQEVNHDNCSYDWNTFAEKCAIYIKELVGSLANSISSNPGDTTNFQLTLRNNFSHHDHTANCTYKICDPKQLPNVNLPTIPASSSSNAQLPASNSGTTHDNSISSHLNDDSAYISHPKNLRHPKVGVVSTHHSDDHSDKKTDIVVPNSQSASQQPLSIVDTGSSTNNGAGAVPDSSIPAVVVAKTHSSHDDSGKGKSATVNIVAPVSNDDGASLAPVAQSDSDCSDDHEHHVSHDVATLAPVAHSDSDCSDSHEHHVSHDVAPLTPTASSLSFDGPILTNNNDAPVSNSHSSPVVAVAQPDSDCSDTDNSQENNGAKSVVVPVAQPQHAQDVSQTTSSGPSSVAVVSPTDNHDASVSHSLPVVSVAQPDSDSLVSHNSQGNNGVASSTPVVVPVAQPDSDCSDSDNSQENNGAESVVVPVAQPQHTQGVSQTASSGPSSVAVVSPTDNHDASVSNSHSSPVVAVAQPDSDCSDSDNLQGNNGAGSSTPVVAPVAQPQDSSQTASSLSFDGPILTNNNDAPVSQSSPVVAVAQPDSDCSDSDNSQENNGAESVVVPVEQPQHTQDISQTASSGPSSVAVVSPTDNHDATVSNSHSSPVVSVAQPQHTQDVLQTASSGPSSVAVVSPTDNHDATVSTSNSSPVVPVVAPVAQSQEPQGSSIVTNPSTSELGNTDCSEQNGASPVAVSVPSSTAHDTDSQHVQDVPIITEQPAPAPNDVGNSVNGAASIPNTGSSPLVFVPNPDSDSLISAEPQGNGPLGIPTSAVPPAPPHRHSQETLVTELPPSVPVNVVPTAVNGAAPVSPPNHDSDSLVSVQPQGSDNSVPLQSDVAPSVVPVVNDQSQSDSNDDCSEGSENVGGTAVVATATPVNEVAVPLTQNDGSDCQTSEDPALGNNGNGELLQGNQLGTNQDAVKPVTSSFQEPPTVVLGESTNGASNSNSGIVSPSTTIDSSPESNLSEMPVNADALGQIDAPVSHGSVLPEDATASDHVNVIPGLVVHQPKDENLVKHPSSITPLINSNSNLPESPGPINNLETVNPSPHIEPLPAASTPIPPSIVTPVYYVPKQTKSINKDKSIYIVTPAPPCSEKTTLVPVESVESVESPIVAPVYIPPKQTISNANSKLPQTGNSQPESLIIAPVAQSNGESVEGSYLTKPTTFQTTSTEPTPPVKVPIPVTQTAPLDSDETTHVIKPPCKHSHKSRDDIEDYEDDCCSCESCTEEEIGNSKHYKEMACKDLDDARKELKAIFDKIQKKLKCGKKQPQKVSASIA